jgi:hypothetical protein
MKLVKQTFKGVALLAAVSISATAQSELYSIESVEVTQLFSSTFDGLIFQKAVDTASGTYFGGIPDISAPVYGVNRAIKFDKNSVYDGGGVISLSNEGLDYADITLPDYTLTIITGETTTLITETSGAEIKINHASADLQADGGDDANFDVGGPLSALNVVETLDFSTFNNISIGDTDGPVLNCVNSAGYCGLLPALSLDGVRYTIEGTPSEAGGDTLTLRVQTSNNSYYEIEMITGPIIQAQLGGAKNVPAMGTFGLVALFGGLVAVAAKLRRKLA